MLLEKYSRFCLHVVTVLRLTSFTSPPLTRVSLESSASDNYLKRDTRHKNYFDNLGSVISVINYDILYSGNSALFLHATPYSSHLQNKRFLFILESL